MAAIKGGADMGDHERALDQGFLSTLLGSYTQGCVGKLMGTMQVHFSPTALEVCVLSSCVVCISTYFRGICSGFQCEALWARFWAVRCQPRACSSHFCSRYRKLEPEVSSDSKVPRPTIPQRQGAILGLSCSLRLGFILSFQGQSFLSS